MKTLPALTCLIESKDALPFVRDSARLCRARWQLEMVEKRRLMASDLDGLTEQSDIQRLQEHLGRMFPSKEVAEQWKNQAVVELDELPETSTNHHVIVFKASDAKVSCSKKTRNGPSRGQLLRRLLRVSHSRQSI